MCGRFTLTMDVKELQEAFPGVDFGLALKPSYNIAPSHSVLTLSNQNPQKAVPFHWGFIPFWAKEKNIGYKMINARSETLTEKPSFKKPFQTQRCLILADGFFEWKKEANAKIPMYIQLKEKKPFAFAGLWSKWLQADKTPLFSCTIITTAANDLLKTVHHRMPVIIQPEHYETWLDSSSQSVEPIKNLLKPFAADAMTFYPVSTFVNSPKNNTAQCVQPQSA